MGAKALEPLLLVLLEMTLLVCGASGDELSSIVFIFGDPPVALLSTFGCCIVVMIDLRLLMAPPARFAKAVMRRCTAGSLAFALMRKAIRKAPRRPARPMMLEVSASSEVFSDSTVEL